ncbi:Yea4p KNAG_0L00740 [Huiozyma naganishii CBS 8797]|uniref:Sugar phosphate transporter domain-containing protein n=1 Tax=Huiozyma naganishii (strain ATCC MYA-139 / BCRC 22969 / CBS 8797 / KCTC 17520 / NBRC 10181 / NCYC 3082 / Yp74L-3) TaxID=1071383 RepID=J7RCU5_HUIN7|nr:hypothetical protein KNAG_0L00740 [Kazachstania naganishii CBS 8797]CCK72695.1 hypothetical protein KNAG_0L00740 [Kazachstania naganishii CBS 8797]
MSSILTSISGIFGGCCGSVITLEYLVQREDGDAASNVTALITFCQFLLVSLIGLRDVVNFEGKLPRLRRLQTPVKIYVLSVILYYTSSITNNSALKYNVSMPIHIVFRCFSTVITVCVCRVLTGRRYSSLQVFSTTLLTSGAVLASLFKEDNFHWNGLQNMVGNFSHQIVYGDSSFMKGVCLLILSSFLSSFLSVLTEWTYTTYGKHWRENVFYLHFLSLPLFLFNHNQIWTEGTLLFNDTKTHTLCYGHICYSVPRKAMYLLGNVLSQYICINGVSKLASQTGALTLSVVLLVRRFISLLLSVYLFNNTLSETGYFGVFLVFLGALIYLLGSQDATRSKKKGWGRIPSRKHTKLYTSRCIHRYTVITALVFEVIIAQRTNRKNTA